MSTQHQPEDEIVNHEKSLRQLAWTLEASVGQFKLLLVRCNYSDLRRRLIERLKEICSVTIQVIQLEESQKKLYSAVKEEIEDSAQAVMVLGLETVRDLPQMLTNANQVREEFRKNLSLPVVLWINDEIHASIMQVAPDFESWATTRNFAISPDELNKFITQLAQQYFSENLSLNGALKLNSELEAAKRDFQTKEPEAKADLFLLLGLVKQASKELDSAIAYYQKAKLLWQQLNNLEKQVKILAEITFCYYLKALKKQDRNHIDWQLTQQCTQEYLEILKQADSDDLISNSVRKIGNILQDLKQWEQLQKLAQQALKIHKSNNQHTELALDYGFLAQAAIEEQQWSEAKQLSQKAIKILAINSSLEAHSAELLNQLLKDIANSQDLSWYEFILAQTEYQLGSTAEAIAHLELAIEASNPQQNLQLHLNILNYLQKLYFEQKEYLKAFQTKQQQRSIEQQFGLRAFIGAGRIQSSKQAQVIESKSEAQESIAPEIAASGRLLDVKRLVERLGRNDYKLIVIYGQSGVGKSSLINGGLVPTLKNNSVGIQDYLPVVMRVYSNWVEDLGKLIHQALKYKGKARNLKFSELDVIISRLRESALIAQLKENERSDLRTVLIFDQFEEFFFIYNEPKQRQQFFEFLGECFNILSVKVILLLRVDYLHYLLECNRLPSMNIIANDILSNNVLYELGNFSPSDAKSIIQSLTVNTSFNLESALLDQLVYELASESGEVRPIELQIVGAQLQNENIRKLKEYQQRGNKEVLIQAYLDEVVHDCGIENQPIAKILLYLLTDEQGTRPLKTRKELERDLQQQFLIDDISINILDKSLISIRKKQVINPELELKKNKFIQSITLDLLLEIFVSSGLVILFTERPHDRYQLVHDYLAFFIRKQQEPTLKILIEKFAESKEKQRISEARLNRYLKVALSVAFLAIFGLSVSIISILDSEIKTLSVSSEALFASQKGIDALKEGIKAGRKLQQALWVDPSTRQQVQTALYQAVSGVREINTLESHTGGVNSAVFSRVSPGLWQSDRSLIVSGSADNTIKLWRADGTLLKTLWGHEDIVNSVSFSPDGQIIASGSQDMTVRLWSREGKLLHTLKGHTAVVNSVSFSPDGQIIASASTDNTVKLWSREGKLLRTLTGHQSSVLDVAWSPDNQILASASADQTIKLWNREGKLLKTWQAHDDAVKSLAWSPDSKTLVSGSLDQTIKLWNLQGQLIRTFSGHTAEITSVSFSPDGHTIASASLDQTVKLWSPTGLLLGTLRGHNNWVNSVNFSSDSRTVISASRDRRVKLWRWDDLLLRNPNSDQADWITSISFSPDSRNIAAASRDSTVKILNSQGQIVRTFKGHKGQVWGVAWSPDGQNIASASKDKTVKIWQLDGKLLHTFTGHQDTVLAVAWSRDGQIIASASKDKTVKLWSRDGKLLHTLTGHQDAVNWVDFSPDGKLLASASNDKTVMIWSRDGNLQKTLKDHNRDVNGVAWSPDNKTLASASTDSTVKLWSRDGQLLKDISGDGDSFISVSFSPDGKMLVAASEDKLKLWNRDGRLLIALKGDKEELTSVTFSPDGKTLAAGSGKGMVVFRALADIKLENLLRWGCDLLHDYLQTNPKISRSDRSLCLKQ